MCTNPRGATHATAAPLPALTWRERLHIVRDLTRGLHYLHCQSPPLLHRGAFACPLELAAGEPTDKFLGYSERMIDLMRQHSVTPLLVFDGADRLVLMREGFLRDLLAEDVRRSPALPSSLKGEV